MDGQKVPISVTVDGEELKQFNQILLNRWKRASSLRIPLQEAANFMLDEIAKNFSGKRGTVFGAQWQKRKRNYPWPLLNKTGKMKDGFKAEIYSDKAVIKNPTRYFKYHQMGTKNMPARKMWGMTEPQARYIRQRLQIYLEAEGER